MENCSRREAEMERVNYFLLLFILLLSAGCAGIERNVSEENIFISSKIPKIKIKIDSSFKYLGKMKKMEEVKYQLPDRTGQQRLEAFIFGNIGDDNTYDKGVIITFSSLEYGRYVLDLFEWVKYKLESKIIKINNKRYQQCIFLHLFFFQNEISNIIYDKGYVIPNCFLIQGLSRNVSPTNNEVMVIYYMEEVSSFNKEKKYECLEWKEMKKIKEDQQKRLDEFKTECQKNVRFLE